MPDDMALSIRHDGQAGRASHPLPGGLLGRLALLAGAAMVVGGLSSPWYRVHIPQALIDGISGGLGTGPADEFARGMLRGVAEMGRRGELTGTGWEAFSYSDIALLVVAVVAAGTVLLRLAGHLERVPSNELMALGLAAGALTGFRMLNPPGASGLLEPMWGAWLTLAGCAAIAVGGWLSQRP
jgi:hypothetical protein